MNTIQVSRCEYKYLLRASEVPELRRYLLQYCEPDAHAGSNEWYGIQSLYLDSADLRLYRASAEKALERMKLRVRSYSGGAGPVKLEVKVRKGDIVTKQSQILPRDLWDSISCSGAHTTGFGRQTESSVFVLAIERLRAAPTMLVQYQRLAFHSIVDDYVRITFDRRIQCQPMREWNLNGNARMWRLVDDPPTVSDHESAYVLELKFRVLAPAWMRDMVLAFGLVRRGFSKYARAVRRTTYDRETAWDLRVSSSIAAGIHL